MAHSGARKATQRGCVVQRAEGKRPGNFMLGFFPGLTLYIHPQLPMSQSKAETALHGCRPGSRHSLVPCPSPFLLAESNCPSLLSLPPASSTPLQHLLRAAQVLPTRKVPLERPKNLAKIKVCFHRKRFLKGKTLLWVTDTLKKKNKHGFNG